MRDVKLNNPPVAKSSWITLGVLTLIYVCHSIDRSVMSILVEPLKAEFSLTDSELGILTGLAYGLFYSLAALPIGYLIDRLNRRKLLATLVGVWSAFTFLCGVAQNYWQLLIARVAVGASEAGGAPTALSMISDVFPEQRRAMAISIFWLSTALGTAISFGLGGYVAEVYGWRTTFMVAGVPGLVLVVVLLAVVKEPLRGAMDPEPDNGGLLETPTLKATFYFAVACKPVRYTMIAMAFKSAVLSGAMVWAAAYLIRVQALPIVEAGVVVGICIAAFGGLGSLLGGIVGDRVFNRYGRKAQPLIAVVTSLLTAAILALFSLAEYIHLAVLAFALFEIASRMHTAPAYAFLISNTSASMRGVIVSGLQIMTNLVGYGLGPYLVGVVSDQVGGSNSLRYGLFSLTLVSILAAWFFYLSHKTLTDSS